MGAKSLALARMRRVSRGESQKRESILNHRWFRSLIVCAGVSLLVSACTNTASMSPADRQSFEGCKAYLKGRSVPYDQAIIEGEKLHRSGNPQAACRREREALKILDGMIGSFQSGRCDRLHDVAGAYISSKVKRLRGKMVRNRQTLQAKINKNCARY